MKKFFSLILVVALMFGCIPTGMAYGQDSPLPERYSQEFFNPAKDYLSDKKDLPPADAEFSESEVIAKMHLTEKNTSPFLFRSTQEQSQEALDLLRRHGINVSDAQTLMTLSDSDTGIMSKGTDASQENLVLLTIDNPGRDNVLDTIELLEAIPEVEYAEPNYIVSSNVQTPNDPDFDRLYGLEKIAAPAAWETTTGSNDILVAVIDSGVDYTHPDLDDNMWINPNAGNLDSYPNDTYGWNFVSNNNDPMDDNGHGTHVAGTIGAEANNGKGIVGVNWNIQLMALKVLDHEGNGTVDNIIRAIFYAEYMGAVISNNSYGIYGYIQSLEEAIAACSHLFVAAAGNDTVDTDILEHYPSGYTLPNVISVASTDSTDILSDFSNYGIGTVDIAAPGTNIYSTLPLGQYGYLSGTSMAAPHVAGAAALILADDPTLTTAELKDQIILTGDKIPSLEYKVASGSRLNVLNALTPVVHTPISLINLSTTAEDITQFDIFVLKSEILPSNTTQHKLEWSTSNPSIAQVMEDGTVVVTGSGYVTITATSVYNAQVSGTYSFTAAVPNPINDFDGGMGTVDNPYQVSTPEHLNNVRRYLDSYFTQTCDIDMGPSTSEGGKYYNDGQGWIALGSIHFNFLFAGYYDGGGYTISNLNADKKGQINSFAGLFGITVGIIQNVNLSGGMLKNGYYTAGIAAYNAGSILGCTSSTNILIEENMRSGFVGGIAAFNHILSPRVIDCLNQSQIEYRGFHSTFFMTFVGGIVGENNCAYLVNCGNTGDITVTPSEYAPIYIGGIAGLTGDSSAEKPFTSNIYVSICFNSGDIYLNGPTYGPLGYSVGGVAGEIHSSNKRDWNSRGVELQNCYNLGNIDIDSDNVWVGGISGYLSDSVIVDCFNTGDITSPSEATEILQGGIIGANIMSEINSVYSTGNLIGSPMYAGHIIGFESPGYSVVSYSYYLSQGDGKEGIGNGTDGARKIESKTDDQMKNPSTFSDWDFNSVWELAPHFHGGYPYLMDTGYFAIDSVTSVALNPVDIGTPFASLPLPDTAEVSLLNGLLAFLPVNWLSDSYSPMNIGAQTIVGTFDLTSPQYDYILNDDGLIPSATVTVMDMSAPPTGSISYDITSATNQNVTATLNIDPGIIVTNNMGSNTYTFTQNGSFEFLIKNDFSGLQGSVIATVTWIDKTSPTATISYSTTAPTKNSVTATLKPSEPVTVTNNGGKSTYTFTKNGSFTFNFKDAVGNTGTATATVSNIESSSAPATYTVSFDYQGITNAGDVENTRKVAANTAIGTLPAPGRIGYTFGGWYSREDGKGTKYTSSSIIRSNMTLYAHWIYVTPPRASEIFSDIPASKWYENAVSFAVKNNLFSGTAPGVFEPETKMNRAMFVTVLGRIAEQMGEKIPNASASFSDVRSGSYYDKYVRWASDNKIVMGYEDGTFRPDNNVSREEAAVLLMRFVDYKKITLPEGKAIIFKDESSISKFAKSAVTRATKAGIIGGYTDGTFKPKNTSTRAEVAQVFYNFLTQ